MLPKDSLADFLQHTSFAAFQEKEIQAKSGYISQRNQKEALHVLLEPSSLVAPFLGSPRGPGTFLSLPKQPIETVSKLKRSHHTY